MARLITEASLEEDLCLQSGQDAEGVPGSEGRGMQTQRQPHGRYVQDLSGCVCSGSIGKCQVLRSGAR